MMPLNEVNRIKRMLEFRRPARSSSENSFITRYLDSVPGMVVDQYGNRLLISQTSRVMISCHTDSVHTFPGWQRVTVSRDGIVGLAKHEKLSNCLGADDCAGIYAALRLIQAKVNATFIFHRDEESGGRGSSWLARNYPKWLETFDVCLALDRRGTSDIIVSQSCGMCASDEFARGLADQLAMTHRPADGIFTDSANYTDLIAECSNLSIGYQNEHSRAETLDLNYLEQVIQKLIRVDWDSLPIAREPGDDGWDWKSATWPHDWEVELDPDLNNDANEDYYSRRWKVKDINT